MPAMAITATADENDQIIDEEQDTEDVDTDTQDPVYENDEQALWVSSRKKLIFCMIHC